MSMAQRIKELREAKHWSQTDLGIETKIRRVSIQSYEKGTKPSGDRLLRIAQVLGVTPQYLLEGEPTGKPPPERELIILKLDNLKKEIDDILEKVKALP